MKTVWISAISFAAGAGIGVGATYLSVKKIFEARADEEIKKMEEYYIKKHDELNSMEEQIKLTTDEKEEYKEIAEQYNTESVEVAEEKPKKSRKKKTKDGKIKEPYVISGAEYEEDNGFDKLIVSYFEEDEVLMFNDETVFDNGHSVLGMMNLEQFGASGDGDDVVYIRNEVFGADYQVVLEEGSYRNFIENQG